MKDELAGWHDLKCWNCGKQASLVTHFGGTKQIKYCVSCFEVRQLPCMKCFIEFQEKGDKEQ